MYLIREHTISRTGYGKKRNILYKDLTMRSPLPYPIFTSNEVKFICNEETDILHIFSLFPSTREHVPIFRSADDKVALKETKILKSVG